MQTQLELPIGSTYLLSSEAINLLKLILMIDMYAPSKIDKQIKEIETEATKLSNESETTEKSLRRRLNAAKTRRKNVHIQKWDTEIPAVQELLEYGYIENIKDQTSGSITLSEETRVRKEQLFEEIRKVSPGTILKFYGDSTQEEAAETIKEVISKRYKEELDEEGRPIPSQIFKTSDHLLRPWDALDTPGWFMFVPKWFNAALGISLMTKRKHLIEYRSWVQSGLFSFKEYDIIYKDKKSWLKGQTNYLRVESASPVSITNGERYPGHVSLSVHGSFLGSTNILEMTQDEFVMFLVTGERKQVTSHGN